VGKEQDSEEEQSMNKMLVAVFNNEPAAYEGLSALKDLHREGEISLYATAVIVKDSGGNVSVKQTDDKGPVGTALGLLTGGLVGIFGGPVGVAAGASVGGLMGTFADLYNADIDSAFLEDVSKALSPGKAAVLADVEESWATPVDIRIGRLGGLVFRRLRSEVVEDRLVREEAASETELEQLQEELAQASAEHKAAVQKEIEAVKRKLEVIRDQAKARFSQLKSEMDARVSSLKDQMRDAGSRQKAKSSASRKQADYEVRSKKIESAGAHPGGSVRLTKTKVLTVQSS
jgi:uncharacterized membrane protein